MYTRVFLIITGPTNGTRLQRMFHTSEYSSTGRTAVMTSSIYVDAYSPNMVDIFEISQFNDVSTIFNFFWNGPLHPTSYNLKSIKTHITPYLSYGGGDRFNYEMVF